MQFYDFLFFASEYENPSDMEDDHESNDFRNLDGHDSSDESETSEFEQEDPSFDIDEILAGVSSIVSSETQEMTQLSRKRSAGDKLSEEGEKERPMKAAKGCHLSI